MDTLDGDPSSSSFGHLSINQKYPREYSYSSGGGKGGGGYFTIPYGFKATPLSSYDFTIEQRDKIYLKENDKSDLPVVIFFYDEFYLMRDKPEAFEKARSMFLSASNTFVMAIFRFCNLSVETVLAEEFKRIREDKTHPFNLIISPSPSAKSDLFVLVYKKGYPQCIYEGPANEGSFKNFLSGLSNPEYLVKLKKTPGTIKEQLWIDYNKTVESKSIVIGKEYLEAFSEAPALIESVIAKPAPWPRGRMEHTTIDSSSKISLTADKNNVDNRGITGKDAEIWKKIITSYVYKLAEKAANDKKNKNPLSAVNLDDKTPKDLAINIANKILESRYNDFYLPSVKNQQKNQQQNKGNGGDAIIKNNALMVYGILTNLLYQSKSVDPLYLKDNNEAIKIAVEFYGYYLYKKDEKINFDDASKLRGAFISEGFPPKYSQLVSVYIVQNDSKVIKFFSEKLSGLIRSYNDRQDNENKVDTDDVLEAIKTNITENFNDVFGKSFDIAKDNGFPIVKYEKEYDDSYTSVGFNDDDELKDIFEDDSFNRSLNNGIRQQLYSKVQNPDK